MEYILMVCNGYCSDEANHNFMNDLKGINVNDIFAEGANGGGKAYFLSEMNSIRIANHSIKQIGKEKTKRSAVLTAENRDAITGAGEWADLHLNVEDVAVKTGDMCFELNIKGRLYIAKQEIRDTQKLVDWWIKDHGPAPDANPVYRAVVLFIRASKAIPDFASEFTEGGFKRKLGSTIGGIFGYSSKVGNTTAEDNYAKRNKGDEKIAFRKIILPKAYIVSYSEDFDNVEGTGYYNVCIRQRYGADMAAEANKPQILEDQIEANAKGGGLSAKISKAAQKKAAARDSTRSMSSSVADTALTGMDMGMTVTDMSLGAKEDSLKNSKK